MLSFWAITAWFNSLDLKKHLLLATLAMATAKWFRTHQKSHQNTSKMNIGLLLEVTFFYQLTMILYEFEFCRIAKRICLLLPLELFLFLPVSKKQLLENMVKGQKFCLCPAKCSAITLRWWLVRQIRWLDYSSLS